MGKAGPKKGELAELRTRVLCLVQEVRDLRATVEMMTPAYEAHLKNREGSREAMRRLRASRKGEVVQ
jgi:hypothetical protein